MHTIQLSDSMLYPLAAMLAEAVRRMVSSRRLATVSEPAFRVRDYQYRDWRDLQTTLRGMQGETRRQVLSTLRREIKIQRREKCMTPDFQTWLQQVRSADAELGTTTTYTPHRPGLFLKAVSHPATEAEPTAQTDHPSPSPADAPPTSCAPASESSAIAELQRALEQLPPSALRPHPRLRALRYDLAKRGAAALQASAEQVSEWLATARTLSAAQKPLTTPPGACAPPAETSLTGPTPPEPGTPLDQEGSAQAPAPQHPTSLPNLPTSSAQPSHATQDASAL